jgi:hypothetical protein
MRPLLWISAAVMAVFVAHASLAADKNAVLGACDRTPQCGYSKNDKNGDISGCILGTKTCFYCPNDGKNQCIKVGQRVVPGQSPKYLGGPDDLLTTMESAAVPAKPKLGTDALTTPVAPAVSQ